MVSLNSLIIFLDLSAPYPCGFQQCGKCLQPTSFLYINSGFPSTLRWHAMITGIPIKAELNQTPHSLLDLLLNIKCGRCGWKSNPTTVIAFLSASGSKPTPSTSGTKDSKAGSSSAAPAQSQPSFPEEAVQRLMSRGFSRHAVLEELRLAGGHEETALAALIAKSFSLP